MLDFVDGYSRDACLAVNGSFGELALLEEPNNLFAGGGG